MENFRLLSRIQLAYDTFPLAVVAGDFNNDKHLNLAIANSGTDNVGILFGNGNGSLQEQMIFSTGHDSRPHAIIVDEFNDDNLLDIAVANYGTNSVGILLGYRNGTFVPQISYSLDAACPYSIATGDLTMDNRLDIVVTNEGANNIGILLGYSNGTFTEVKPVLALNHTRLPSLISIMTLLLI
jgi:hypothetical protein